MDEQNSIDGFYVFEVTECDWVVARTADEAREFYKSQTGSDENLYDKIEPMTNDELLRFTFTDDDGKRSFMEELARLAEDEELKTDFFATTEY